MADGKDVTIKKEPEKNTFLEEMAKYIQSVHKRAEDYWSPPYSFNEDGSKKYPIDYIEEINLDKLKFMWFFKAINYDREICEAVLHPKATLIRQELLDMKLADLVISAKIKEMYILSGWNNSVINQ